MPEFVSLVRGQLDEAKAIRNHLFGLQQFVIGQPVWETYLKGEEQDPRAQFGPCSHARPPALAYSPREAPALAVQSPASPSARCSCASSMRSEPVA